jgi:hypothetical protein
MSDDKEIVSYMASAVVIRLTDLQHASKPKQEKKQTTKKG